jgi:hypothetical protein
MRWPTPSVPDQSWCMMPMRRASRPEVRVRRSGQSVARQQSGSDRSVPLDRDTLIVDFDLNAALVFLRIQVDYNNEAGDQQTNNEIKRVAGHVNVSFSGATISQHLYVLLKHITISILWALLGALR